jgi:hypothetical protein
MAFCAIQGFFVLAENRLAIHKLAGCGREGTDSDIVTETSRNGFAG